MKNPSYLFKRGNTYYFRQVVPTNLISTLNLREIKRSLATDNRKEAVNRAMRLSSQLDDLFRKVKFGEMRYDQLKPELKRIYHDLLGVQDKYIKREGPKGTDRIKMLTKASSEFKQLSEYLGNGDTTTYKNFLSRSENKEFLTSRIERRLSNLGEDGSLDTKAGVRVLGALTNMLSKFYDETVKMHKLEFEYDPLVTPAYVTIDANDISPKLSKVIEEFSFEKMRAGQWTPKTEKQNQAQFNQLLEIIGDKETNAVTHQDARLFKDVISNLPPHVNKVRASKYSGKSLIQVSKLTHTKRNTIKTINSYIQTASCLFVWASDQGYCEQDYFKRLKLIRSHKKINRERDAFTIDELNQIEDKALQERDQWKKWIVLIGVYSGMRLNEICQLYIDDVVEINDILCFKLTEYREDQSLKNANSERIVPVHLKLIEHGLKDYIALLKRQRVERLFPKLKYSDTNYYSHQVTKWFSRTFMKKLNLEDGSKSFHSFRHAMATVLKNTDVKESKISELLGHAHQTITLGRYADDYDVQSLSEAINKFNVSSD